MRRLSENERRDAIERLGRLVSVPNALDPRLTAEAEIRAILFPVDTEMDADELRAIATASRVAGDVGIFLSFIDLADWESSEDHWFISLQELESNGIILDDLSWRGDYALYSPSSAWVMIRSEEQHATVGANRDAGNALLDSYPPERPMYDPHGIAPAKVPAREQVLSFVEWWRSQATAGSNIDWVRPFLEHVYPRKADALLKQLIEDMPAGGEEAK